MRRRALVPVASIVLFLGCRAAVTEPQLEPAWSSDRAQVPLSRADCIDLALGSTPNAAAWQARILAARASLESARLLANPVLSLGWEDFGLGQGATSSPVQTTLTLAMALEDVIAHRRRAHAAQHELDALEADVRGEMMLLAARVSHSYDELVGARVRTALETELLAVSEKQRDDVRAFVTQGLSPRIDLERAEAECAEARASSAKAESAARALELEFVFALGFERPTSLQLSDALSSATEVASRELGDVLAAAADARHEIRAAAARYQAELERLRLAAERIQFLPTLAAGPRRQGDEYRGVATIDVALPIFDSGSAAQHGHEAALLAAAAALRASAHAVAREVCTALDRLVTAEAYLAEHARDLEARRRTLRERTEILFRAGELPYADLALARRDEVDARIALLDAELAVASARVDLDAAAGALRSPAVDRR